MELRHLWLVDFRSYASADVALAPGLTAVLGDNGEGKTNLLEAIAWLATLESFRGVSTDALVREGAPHAVIRAEGVGEQGRDVRIEAQLAATGRNRVQVNRQALKRARDLLGVLRATVFAPDDLALVKAGPAERRRYLDEVLVALHPRNDALRATVDRVLRQRNALLKQSGRRPDADVLRTLDVWDDHLAAAGESLAAARQALVDELAPVLAATYDDLAQRPAAIVARYDASWREQGLALALAGARSDDLRRGVSTVGPHRDELALGIDGRPARTHASQGEQRSLALAMRLGAHRLVTETTGVRPVLLLDDVFSELDPGRGDALLANLPAGQTVLTSAHGLPPKADPDLVLQVAGGRVAPA